MEQIGVEARVQTAIEMKNVAEPFILGRAVRHLELGRVVIFAAGTGNPYFSTDTTAALRASEIRADVILKATKVDGVYDRDPNKFPDARRYDRLTFTEALTKRLQIIDSTASVSAWTTKSRSLCSTCTSRESCATPCWDGMSELWFAMMLQQSKHSPI